MKTSILIAMLLAVCNNINFNSSESILQFEIRQPHLSNECEKRVINQGLIDNFFLIEVFRSDNEARRSIFRKEPIARKFSQNDSESGKSDDFIEYSYNCSSVTFFLKDSTECYVESAMIMGDDLILFRNIHIGMPKELFFDRIAVEPTECDLLIIEDEDRTFPIYFRFEKGNLHQIEIKPFV